MIDRVSFEKTTYAPAPTRFEAGTLAIVEAIGFGAAVDYVQSIGLEAIHAHEAALVRHLRRELAAMNDVRLFGPEDRRHRQLRAGRCTRTIWAPYGRRRPGHGSVAIRAGHHCAQPLMAHLGVPATARASFGPYSDESDIAALLAGIERRRGFSDEQRSPRFTVEEVNAPTPPRARVADAAPSTPEAAPQETRPKDYLDGLAQQPTGLVPHEPGGELYEGVISALKDIFDPEIPVNIYDLGLIYGVEITPMPPPPSP
jgi:hypothetical protein